MIRVAKATAILQRHRLGGSPVAIPNTVGSALACIRNQCGVKEAADDRKKKKGANRNHSPTLSPAQPVSPKGSRHYPQKDSGLSNTPTKTALQSLIIRASSSSPRKSLRRATISRRPHFGRRSRLGFGDSAPWTIEPRWTLPGCKGGLLDAKAEPKGEKSRGSSERERIGPYEKQALESAKALLGALVMRLGRGNLTGKRLRKCSHRRSHRCFGVTNHPRDSARRCAWPFLHGARSRGGFTNIASYVRDGDRTPISPLLARVQRHPAIDLDEPARDETVRFRSSTFKDSPPLKVSGVSLDDENGCWSRLFASEVVRE